MLLFQPFPQRVHDPFFVGEFAGLKFRVDEVAVDGDLETAAFRRDEFEIFDLLFVGDEKSGRQTDGLGFVVSHRAIFEFHIHDLILLLTEQYNSMQ
jgi:hypothetical protein